MIFKMTRIMDEFGLRPATSAEARVALGLKGKAHTYFG